MSTETNYLAMSDEDFLKQPQPEFVETPETEVVTEPAPVETTEPVATDVVPEPEKEEEVTTEAVEEPDYKAFYEKLTGEFKANGTNIRIESPDEIISLMQRGANYTKKMQDLRVPRAMYELLEQNGLTDPDQLGFLLDLHKKNPTAIAKLAKDTGVDLYEQEEHLANYKPTKAVFNEQSIIVQDVFDSLKDSNSYSTLIGTIKDFDQTSKQEMATNPTLISQLHAQMENGTYAKVSSALAVERAKGNFTNMPDLQAYISVGQMMHDQGLLQPVVATPKPVPAKPKPSVPKPNTVPEVEQRRQAAAAPSGTPTNTPTNAPDFLKMSDAEFLAYRAKNGV